MPPNDDTSSSPLILRSGRRISKETNNENIVSVRHASNHDGISAFPFLKLPAELRIQVYQNLLHARSNVYIDHSEAGKRILCSRFGRQSTRSWDAYKNNTYKVTANGLHPAILSVNRQTYLEATKILYSENRFTFRPFVIAAVIPFLQGRCERSRRLIREIEYFYMVTGSFFGPILGEQDHAWKYLDQNLQLQHLTLQLWGLPPKSTLGSDLHSIYVANVHELDWVQWLVPLAKKLKTLALVGCRKDDAELVHAVQTYLDSKMAEANNTPSQRQISHLGPDSAAQE